MKISVRIFIAAVIALNLAGCSNDSLYQDEHYKNLVFLLSGTKNVYVASYTLNETELDRYVTIGCGGSNTNEKSVTINLEQDTELIDRYNIMTFDQEYQYAKILPADRYNIFSYSVTVRANSSYHYERLPVKVRPLGLSPDSIYFIPLKIVSVSEYEVNENKQDVLFRVAIENNFATQVPQTLYRKDGVVENPYTVLSGSRVVHPLTKDKVRMFVENLNYNDATTPAIINRNAVVVQIHADNSLTVTPYDPTMMEVEMLDNVNDNENFNRYNPAYMQGVTKQRVFWLNYSFRQRPLDGGEFGPWRNVEERLTRIEAD